MTTVVEHRQTELYTATVKNSYRKYVFRGSRVNYVDVRLNNGEELSARGKASVGHVVCVEAKIGAVSGHVNAQLRLMALCNG